MDRQEATSGLSTSTTCQYQILGVVSLGNQMYKELIWRMFCANFAGAQRAF